MATYKFTPTGGGGDKDASKKEQGALSQIPDIGRFTTAVGDLITPNSFTIEGLPTLIRSIEQVLSGKTTSGSGLQSADLSSLVDFNGRLAQLLSGWRSVTRLPLFANVWSENKDALAAQSREAMLGSLKFVDADISGLQIIVKKAPKMVLSTIGKKTIEDIANRAVVTRVAGKPHEEEEALISVVKNLVIMSAPYLQVDKSYTFKSVGSIKF